MKKYMFISVLGLLISISNLVFGAIVVLDTVYVNNSKIHATEPFRWDFKIITICKNGYQYTITTNSSGTNIAQDFQGGSKQELRVIACESK